MPSRSSKKKSSASAANKTPSKSQPGARASPADSGVVGKALSVPQQVFGILDELRASYASETSARVMALDSFMAFCAVIAVGLFGYMMLFGTFPFNAFLSAFFCAIGMFVLTGESTGLLP